MKKPAKRHCTFGGIVGTVELRLLQNGKAILSFGLGMCVDPSTDGLTWITCKAWEGSARAIALNIEKGDKIVVTGPVDQWQGKWSVTVYDYAVIRRGDSKYERLSGHAQPSNGYSDTEGYEK